MLSLRSLCLLKFHSLKQEIPDLSQAPPSIVKDLKTMKLVNSNFVGISSYPSHLYGQVMTQTALKVQYDGVSWLFSYYNNRFYEDSCYKCDFIKPDLKHFKLEENKAATPVSPFRNYCSDRLERRWLKKHPYSWNVKMFFSFDLNEEGTKGILSFRGVWRNWGFLKDFGEYDGLSRRFSCIHTMLLEIDDETVIKLKLNSDLGFEDVAPYAFTYNMVVELNDGERKVHSSDRYNGWRTDEPIEVFKVVLDETSVPTEQSITAPPGPCSCPELEEEQETQEELEEEQENPADTGNT